MCTILHIKKMRSANIINRLLVTSIKILSLLNRLVLNFSRRVVIVGC